MAHTVVLTDVPAESVDEVLADFAAEGATATKTLQPNGNYTVTASVPDAQSALKMAASAHGVVQHALLSWKGKGK